MAWFSNQPMPISIVSEVSCSIFKLGCKCETRHSIIACGFTFCFGFSVNKILTKPWHDKIVVRVWYNRQFDSSPSQNKQSCERENIRYSVDCRANSIGDQSMLLFHHCNFSRCTRYSCHEIIVNQSIQLLTWKLSSVHLLRHIYQRVWA